LKGHQKEWSDKIYNQSSPQKKLQTLDLFLQELAMNPSRQKALADSIIQFIHQKRGQLKIQEISERFGLNYKYLERLSADAGTEAHPRWSPDGQWILFNIFPEQDDQPSDVFILNPWTKERKNITQGKYPDGQACDWHPGGQSLLFSAGPFPGINVYQYELKHGEVRQLTSEKRKISYYASYAPNGKSILYSVFSRSDKGIYQMNKNGEHAIKLIDQGQAPSWSPDGRSVFFHRDMDGQKSLLRLDLKNGYESTIF
jgi:Tol biopolymer transport system component